ncbi:MAG: tetratricopeptide repeat protein [Syntrophales bacterium]
MNRLNIIHAVLAACALAIMACGTSPWNQEQADAHINVGTAYLGSGRSNEALKEFLEAEKLSPQDPRVHYYMGISYLEKGLTDNAMAEFQKAVSLKPDYSEAHNFLGVIYRDKKQWDMAIDEFKKALANVLYETPDKAIFNMATAYDGKGDYQKALKLYEEAKNKQPHTVPAPVIDLYIGRTYYAQGNLGKAVSYFKATLQVAPSLLESHYWLGHCYIKLNEPAKARAEFRTIIELTPDSGLGIEAKKSLDAMTSSR